jgi:hypothetical protein
LRCFLAIRARRFARTAKCSARLSRVFAPIFTRFFLHTRLTPYRAKSRIDGRNVSGAQYHAGTRNNARIDRTTSLNRTRDNPVNREVPEKAANKRSAPNIRVARQLKMKERRSA